MAFFEAEGGGDAVAAEDGVEGAAVFGGGAFPGEAFDVVVGDEVDLGAGGGGAFDEEAGFVEVVVDAFDEDILEGELLFLLRVPVAEGVHEFIDAPLLVHRHDLVAHVVAGAVEGNGEADLLRVVGEFSDLRDESGSGDGEVPGADVQSPIGGDDLDGLEEMGEVGEGFAHAHEDDVVDLFSADFLGEEDLSGDFVGGEIAREPVESGGAEFAAVGAADLGGDAEGAAVGLGSVEAGGGGDEDALDVAAVVEAEEELAGGVFGALGFGVLEPIEIEVHGEFLPQGGGEVGHLLDGGDPLFPDPVEDLFGAVGLLVEFFEVLGELGLVESVKTDGHGRGGWG